MLALLKNSHRYSFLRSFTSSLSTFTNTTSSLNLTKQLHSVTSISFSNGNRNDDNDDDSNSNSLADNNSGYYQSRSQQDNHMSGNDNGYNNRSQKSYNGNRTGSNNSMSSGYNSKPYNGFYNKSKYGDESSTNKEGHGFNWKSSNNNNNNSGYGENELGENLHDVDYSKEELKPFKKVFYSNDSPMHSEAETAQYRQEKGILFRSRHVDLPQPFFTWAETRFPKYIMSIVENNKFSDPMPIQAQSFPIVLSGHDLIGIAQTGSGKTLSYVLPSLIHINAQEPVRSGEGPVVLVLAPTRELANQIKEECLKFGEKCKIRSVCVYGGAPKISQQKELQRGCDIVIATPGRLIDFLEGNVIDLKRVTYLVLDEADRMLDMGFEPSIRKILGQIRPDRQTLMFSATWPQSVRRLALDFCQKDPIHLQIGDMENNVNNDIEQIVEVMNKRQKYVRAKEILQGMSREEKTIIFTQTKKDCDELNEALQGDDMRVACIHGDKSQRERDRAMDLFKSGRVNTLIATDVASRGIDVKDIKLVINFDFPKQIEDYVHRVGRTGRAGATGKAISFIDHYEDKKILKDLVDVLKQNKQVINEDLLDLAQSNPRGGYGNGMSKNRGFSNKSYSPRDGNRNMNSAYETTGFKSSSHSNEGSSRNNYNSSRKYNEDDDDNNSSNFYNSRKETN